MFSFLKRLFGSSQQRTLARYDKIVNEVNAIEEKLQQLSDDEVKAKTLVLKERLSQGETLDAVLPEAFAVVKNACRRFFGTEVHVSGYDQRWDMIPYDVQIKGAIALHKGFITEMQTGEGKTITAVMPLYLNALTGKPVHIVTVNEYLAERDCQWVGSIFRWLGLTTGVIFQDMNYDDRRMIYESDIVYGTASEFGFDYLRDNSIATKKEDLVQRGHYYALIDEVDSILIDEARTPLIISGPSTASRQLYDVLQEGVGALVQKQREMCNKIATDAKKQLEKYLGEDHDVVKQFTSQDQEALRKMWLVNKGTPRNRVLKRLREDPDMRTAIDKWDLYYYNDQNKEERAKALAELFIIIDEKSQEYELTDKGITAWQECGGKEDDFVMLDLSHEFVLIDYNLDLTDEEKVQKKLELQEQDALRKERSLNLRQLLRAHLLMERDVEYIVQEDKVIIIDENTGRPQPGRRFSDGLHQAIEAKENVSIQKETQTFATITLQNYFRMYKKLAGMTGTAITEAQELKEIYKLDVLPIPTYRNCIRQDFNDEMYMTEREKYNAILKEVKEIHGKGRPILLGTESVEVSEKLSRILKLNHLDHTVLNAKQHDSEAEIISQAGQKCAITIATNMAGRGTDIKLGDGIAPTGGLHVIGSTRHQSRRIDRQLRGRSARQGDPGSSKFFISLEDPLMRLFASPAMIGMLHRFRPEEGEPISAPILNRSIETAQKRIEGRNYMVRKHTLEYDDVMNKQRQEMYSFRHELLTTDSSYIMAVELLESLIVAQTHNFFDKRNTGAESGREAYRAWLCLHFPLTFDATVIENERLDADDTAEKVIGKVLKGFEAKIESEKQKAHELVQREDFDPNTIINDAIRSIMVRTIDHLWQEHLLTMDHLRQDVHLRAVGQKDPLMEFKHEAFLLFERFTLHLKEEIAQALFKFEIFPTKHFTLNEIAGFLHLETDRSLVSDFEEETEMNTVDIQPSESSYEPTTPLTLLEPKTGRNDNCPCGSGKKYKKCCGAGKDELLHL